MKLLVFILFILFAFLNSPVQSQTVSIEIEDRHTHLERGTFATDSGTMSFSGNALVVDGNVNQYRIPSPITSSLSREIKKAGLIATDDGSVKRKTIDHRGLTLSETELEFIDPADGSIHIVQFDNGSSVIRDNIANFNFYDPAGNRYASVSNSSQSPDGELVSGIDSDKSGINVVLYNPVIRSGSSEGSRASLLRNGRQNLQPFFQRDDRIINDVSFSENGSFILIISASAANNYVTVFDRFGNEIYELDAEIVPQGASLTNNGRFLTVYSSGRAQVYNILTAERAGSASLRGNVIYASYQPEDDTIVMLGGEGTQSGVTNPGITAVNIGGRQIARGEINTELTYGRENLNIERIGANNYRLTGFNKNLIISTRF